MADENMNVENGQNTERSWNDLKIFFAQAQMEGEDFYVPNDKFEAKIEEVKKENLGSELEEKEEAVGRYLFDTVNWGAFQTEGNDENFEIVGQKWAFIEDIETNVVNGTIADQNDIQRILDEKLQTSELYKELSNKTTELSWEDLSDLFADHWENGETLRNDYFYFAKNRIDASSGYNDKTEFEKKIMASERAIYNTVTEYVLHHSDGETFNNLSEETILNFSNELANDYVTGKITEKSRNFEKDLLQRFEKSLSEANRPLQFNEEKDIPLMQDITSVLSESEVFLQDNPTLGNVRVRLGNPQHNGLSHIVKRRMDKLIEHNGLSFEEAQKETTAVLFLAVKNIAEAPATKETNGRHCIYKNGIKTVIDTDKNGKFIVTGFDFDDTKKEAVDAIMSVNAHYGYTPEFLGIYAQVGATYASLTNNIAQQNSPVNENQESKDFNNAVENRFNNAAQKLSSNLNSENYKEAFDLLSKMEELAGISVEKPVSELEKTVETTINTKKEVEVKNDSVEQSATVVSKDELKKEAQDKQVVQNMLNEEAEKEELASGIILGKTVLPSFLGIVDNKLESMENYVVDSYDQQSDKYVLKNGDKDFYLKKDALNSILNPKHIEQEIKQDAAEVKMQATPTIVFDNPERGTKGTTLPEFSINDINGNLTLYKGYSVKSFNKGENTYTLSDGEKSMTVTGDKFKEITAPERWNMTFTKDSKIEDRMLSAQYNDFFKERANTAYNFVHNLSVKCRKEADNPIEALRVAKWIVDKMPKEEQKKCKELLKTVKGNSTINEFIVNTYHSAIKSIPLNENYIKRNKPNDVIARPFYDTISDDGKAIEKDQSLVRGEKDYNLKIGDTITNINIKNKKVFGVGSEKVHFDELKVVSASKEGNTITLMDGNRSFLKMPLDNVLNSYKEKTMNDINRTEKYERKTSMSLGYN